VRSRASALASLATLLVVLAGSDRPSAAAARASRLPDFAVATDPAWSPDGTEIAFVVRDRMLGTLYVMRADGTRTRRVIERTFDAGWPSWSPDGRSIAFDHATGTAATPSDVYAVDADGGRLRKVVSDAAQPAWGPGGRRIAFVRRGRLGNELVHTVFPDGADVRLVADPHDECEIFVEPTWSPDGERVAFAADGAGLECGSRIFIGVSRGFGGRVRVLASGWFEQPDWSPTGTRIAVVRTPHIGGELRPRVAIVDLRTRRTRYLRAGWHPRWSPDGRRLVFVRGDAFASDPRSRLFVMNADGSGLRPLTR
jgi:TolB protein